MSGFLFGGPLGPKFKLFTYLYCYKIDNRWYKQSATYY